MNASDKSIKIRWVGLLAIFGAAVLSFGITVTCFAFCESLPANARDLGVATFAPILIIEELMDLFAGWRPEWSPLKVFMMIWLFYSILFLGIVRFGSGKIFKRIPPDIRS